jgi:RNA recognition motif-containing protein
MNKIFVGNLSYNTNDDSLRDAFASFGSVTEAKVILDRESGKSRGFGFVEFSTSDEADKAIADMDGQELDGRALTVNVAQERKPRDGGGGGGRGGGRNRSGGGGRR